MKTVVIVLVVVVAVVAALPVQWVELKQSSSRSVGDVYQFCNSSANPLVVNRVILSPDPPKKGEDVNITISYTLKEKVTGGEVSLDAKASIIPIKKTWELCDFLQDYTSIKCPLSQETTTSSATVKVPSVSVSGNIKAYDQNKQELLCLNFDI